MVTASRETTLRGFPRKARQSFVVGVDTAGGGDVGILCLEPMVPADWAVSSFVQNKAPRCYIGAFFVQMFPIKSANFLSNRLAIPVKDNQMVMMRNTEMIPVTIDWMIARCATLSNKTRIVL